MVREDWRIERLEGRKGEKREGIESMLITFQQRKKRKKDESMQPTEI